MRVALQSDKKTVDSIEFEGTIRHDYDKGTDLVVLPELRKMENYPWGSKVKVTIELIKGD